MKKYLDEMTKEELIHLAMQECILLELTFDKEKIMKKLEQKGYERIKETGSLPKKEKVSAEEKEIYLDEENENIEKKGGYEDMKEDLKLKGTEVIEEETQVEEVEEALQPHLNIPYLISKCRDEKFGEVVVLLTECADLHLIQSVCCKVLPRFWRPKHYFYTPHIPFTATGKPARKKAEAWCNMQLKSQDYLGML